ncbi:uncharacterized protein LOC125383487 [Haliotis rufescens]|uniref:uncharacterized protein LOC125383487 n=1 Tax=Haliotis rufescens TaxID=6454 RepID=UPI00201EA697|nr:uncharacterized protein LOC125383487 [Haliotis rufescens]
MWKLFVILSVVVFLGVMMETDAKNTKRRMLQKPESGDAAALQSLKKNISSLWTEMHKKLESRVMVHVHGMGDDHAETHAGQDGTHVHIHLHMDDHHGGHDDHYEDDCDEEYHHGSHESHEESDESHAHNDSHEGHDHHGSHEGHEGHGHHGSHEGHGHRDHHRGCRGRKRNAYIYGRCNMAMGNEPSKSGPRNNITGAVYLRQKVRGPLEILLELRGFYIPSGHSDHSVHMHGFHVHEFGDFSAGCTSSGGHYNPDGGDHGGHDSEKRHAGDWGNISCDDAGEVHMNMTDKYCDLYGPHSIIGRGLVIHETADHLGRAPMGTKKKGGQTGYGNACCTIARTGTLDWEMLLKHKH